VILRRTRYLAPEPPEVSILHAATYLRRPAGWRTARAFSQFNRAAEVHLAQTPGALAYSLQRILFGRDAWTLSLWVDRSSMLAFLRTSSHALAADWLKSTGASDVLGPATASSLSGKRIVRA
jgi:hypothetical protein